MSIESHAEVPRPAAVKSGKRVEIHQADKRYVRWFLAGPFAVFGCTWLVTMSRMLVGTAIGDWQPYANHGVGALLGGWLLARAAPFSMRMKRAIAAWAAIGTIALYVALFLLPEEVYFQWSPASHGSPWRLVAAYTLVSLTGALIGALLARLQGPSTSVKLPKLRWLAISAALTLGFMMAAGHALGAFGPVESREISNTIALVMFGVIVAGGAATQLLAPHKMVRVCGGGGVVLLVVFLDRALRGETSVGATDIGRMLMAVVVWVLLGMLGAYLASRFAKIGAPRTDVPQLSRATAKS